MNNVIVYQVKGRPAAIVTPAPKCELPVSEIADKDVPTGIPYWIVDRSEVEALYAQHGKHRDAWEISQETMGRAPDGVGK